MRHFKIEAQPDRKKPIPDEIPPFIEPGKGKIFHVTAICARKAEKVDQPKKKKECYYYFNTIDHQALVIRRVSFSMRQRSFLNTK